MPKVTVFTTVYNIAKYLPRFFECMERQSFPDYKHLIIDDGSDDGSYEICMKQAEKDERIEVLCIEHKGISSARNLALSILDTPFAASADGDDIYEVDYLRHLVEAEEKYDADLVISRVAYRNEFYKLTWENPKRGEIVIDRINFLEKLPILLEDARLNFLYGKLYRTEILKEIRVQDDVEQGSDTMINCQYLNKTDRIVCIDDMDANWIQYSSHSVTSYKGKNMYRRLFRIQEYIMDSFQVSGFLNEEMQRVIDKRYFQSCRWSLQRLPTSETDINEAIKTVCELASDTRYADAYQRQKQRGDLEAYGFRILAPEEILPAYVEKQIDTLENRVKNVEKECERIKAQNRYLKDVIFDLKHSVSFRIGRSITYPCRIIKDLLRKKAF